MSTSTINESRSNSVGSIIAKVVGIVLIVIGSLASIAAIALIALFGPSGRLDSGAHQVASSAAAVVADISKIPNVNGVITITGRPQIQLDVSGGNASGVFVGIGRTTDVDRYLAGVATDQVTDVGVRPFELRVDRVPGRASAAPPAAQNFWVASATSPSDAQLDWPVANGNYRLVVMNADGASNMISQARVQLVVPDMFWLSVVALAVGFTITAGGIVILVRSVTRERPASV